MRFDFLDWYNEAYPVANFDSPDDRREHQLISYNGWLAAMKTYGIKVLG
jgi:hypothetical protein